MWLKNLIIFKIENSPLLRMDAAQIAEKLEERRSRKCGPMEMSTYGWGEVQPDSDSPIFGINGDQIMICMEAKQKILPASVVREALNERIKEIEESECRDVRNKEKARLRDEIVIQLLPQSHSKTVKTHAVIDLENQRLLINTATRNRAEAVSVLLRETIGSLELLNPDTDSSPSAAMSQWLFHGAPPGGFTIDDECWIQENDDAGGTIKAKHIDITQDAIRKHLESQSRVIRMGMSHNDRISFVLDQNFTIRSIKPLEVIDNMREEHDDVDAEALFKADLILFVAEINGLLKRLFEVLGGDS